MPKRRGVVVHNTGDVYLADGKTQETTRTPFDLDALFQAGWRIDKGPLPIGEPSTSFLLIVVEPDQPLPAPPPEGNPPPG